MAEERLILIAEDEESSAVMLQYRLEKAGYQVVMAPDGLQALEMAKNLRPLVSLIDLGLPSLDGISVIKNLKKDINSASLRVVVLSGSDDIDNVRKATEAGADGYLIKPVDFQKLINLIQTENVDITKNETVTLDSKSLLAWLSGDRDLAISVLNRFLELWPVYVSDIDEAARNGDSKSLAKSAHKLAGALANISHEGVFVEAKAVEEEAINGVIRPLGKLHSELEALAKVVEQYCANN